MIWLRVILKIPEVPLCKPVIAPFPLSSVMVLFVTVLPDKPPFTMIPVFAKAPLRLINVTRFDDTVCSAATAVVDIPVKIPEPVRAELRTSLLFILATEANAAVFDKPVTAPVPVSLKEITLFPVIVSIPPPAAFTIPVKTEIPVPYTLEFCTVLPVIEIVPVAVLFMPLKVHTPVVVVPFVPIQTELAKLDPTELVDMLKLPSVPEVLIPLNV